MTTIRPRPYQVNGIVKLREKIIFDKKKRVILMCPTGGGKGLVMAMLVEMALKKDNSALTILYGSDLIRQTEKNYKRYYGIESRVIMGGIKSPPEKSTIASISTLHRREFPKADFIIIDECHQSKSPTYKKIFDNYPDTIIIGLSATPFNNLDNFEDYIVLATVKELIALGFLVQPKHFAPKKMIDTSSLKIKRGEWEDEDIEREALKIVGDVMLEWKSRANDRQTVVFCATVKHSLEMCQAFLNEGISAMHIDGESTIEERNHAIESIQNGNIKVICNVMVFSVGIDCPEIGCVIMLRPTHSEILYIQQGGRGLRPAKNKNDCIIIDHANNVSRFGLLTDEREPNIMPKDKNQKKDKNGEAEIKIWVCKLCYCTNEFLSKVCMECGAPKPKKESKVKGGDGELEELTESPKKKQKIYLGDTMPFGKHSGTAFELLPYQYLVWASSNMDNKNGVQLRCKVELERRGF